MTKAPTWKQKKNKKYPQNTPVTGNHGRKGIFCVISLNSTANPKCQLSSILLMQHITLVCYLTVIDAIARMNQTASNAFGK
jgi:hypothetical protein